MRILATADLHYEWHESARELVRALAKQMCAVGGDVLIVAGDTFAFDPLILEECLALFAPFRGARLLVPGNHDLWVHGDSSWPVFEEVIPNVCERSGFHYLEQEPFVMGAVGLVGTIGWYDYSMRPWNLNVADRFYEAKTGPGYAIVKPEWRHLVLPPYPPPTESDLRVVTQWQDIRHVHLGMSDAEFTALLAAKLRRHIAEVRDQVDDIVGVFHHLPFKDAVRSRPGPAWQFGSAFMGAEVFGEVLDAEPKARMAIYGHSHMDGIVQHGRIKGVNCGSTYRHKQFVVVETETWAAEYRQ